MPELLHFVRPDGKTSSVVSILKEEIFPTSGIEGPRKVSVGVYNRGLIRHVSMVTKRPRLFCPSLQDGETPADRFINIWTRLKAADIPVVPTVRKISDAEVAMTDLTRYGSIIYGKHQASNIEALPTDPLSLTIHAAFLRINPSQFEQLTRKIFDNATRNNILLAFDDPLDLVVKPNGSWYLIALDIGGTSFNHSATAKKNIESCGYVMSWLRDLQNSISYLLPATRTYLSPYLL